MYVLVNLLLSSLAFRPCANRLTSRDPLRHLSTQASVHHFSRRKVVQFATVDDMNWDPKSAPKLDFNEDLYAVIEVDGSCSPQELKRAYYKIVFKYHPDNKEGETAKKLCNQQMMVINAGKQRFSN